jgi:hypothetical protein
MKHSKMPTPVPVKDTHNGYPNNVPNTQTVKVRGTGCATKGTGASKKMG